MADLMQVSGLWKNTSANGEMYLQGKLGSNVRILIFKNKYKTADNQPDYILNFTPIERKEERPARSEDDDFLGAPGGANAQDEEEDFQEGKRRETPQERADREHRERQVPRRPGATPTRSPDTSLGATNADGHAMERVGDQLLEVPPARDQHYADGPQPPPEVPRPLPVPPARPVDRLAAKPGSGTTSSTSPGPTPARPAAGSHRRTTPEPASSSYDDLGEMEDPFAS